MTIEKENVVERYLLGRLSAEETARFEEHYLDDPECLEQLELTRRLHDGLRSVAAEEGAHLTRTAVFAWLLRRGRVLGAVGVLALFALLILPWAFLAPSVSRLSGELDRALAPRVGTPTYTLSPERSAPGEGPSTRVTLRSAPEWVTLTLHLPPGQEPADYRVRLGETGREPLWRSGPIASDPSGRVTLSVHSSWLQAADYVVELEALAPEEASRPVARFAFRVRREE